MINLDNIRTVFIVIGNRVLTQVQRNNDRRMQRTYEELVAAEQKRMADEYRQKSDEMIRRWQEQLDEEKFKLQQVIVYSSFFTNLSISFVGFR